MANSKIRGITIEIGGDTTKLDKALGNVDKKVKGTQVELREVNKLLKIDPTNTEMLAQKQALLSDAISETKEKLDILKNAESQVQEQFKKGEVSEEQYKALQRELGRTEVELANLEEAARQTDTAIEQLGKSSGLSGEELKKQRKRPGHSRKAWTGWPKRPRRRPRHWGPDLWPPLHTQRSLKQIAIRH